MYAGEAKPANLGNPGKLTKADLFRRAAPYALVGIPEIVGHLSLIRAHMLAGAHAYVFLPSGEYFEPALRALIDDGWVFQRLLIWDKAPHGGGGIGSTWSGAFEPIVLLSNGKPRASPGKGRMWPTVLRQRPTKTRTSKPPQLYRLFMEASTRPGELVVDPYCGLDPLQAAAIMEPARAWRSNDVLPPMEVEAQARER